MNPPSRPSPSTLQSDLSSELLTKHSLPVSPQWLSAFLSTIKSPPPPLPALTSTAHFRLLNSDFTNSLLSTPTPTSSFTNTTTTITPSPSPSSSPLLLPPELSDVNVKSTTLSWNIPMQVLSIQDVGSSRYAQIESIERVERGEEVKGREVVRVLPVGDEEGDSTSASNSVSTSTGAAAAAVAKRSSGPHKVLLQDAAGTKIFGFEVGDVPKLFITVNAEDGGIQIGCKVLVRKGTVVRRGLVMLTSDGTSVLGGKVETWDKLWRGGRKENLRNEMVEGAGEE